MLVQPGVCPGLRGEALQESHALPPVGHGGILEHQRALPVLDPVVDRAPADLALAEGEVLVHVPEVVVGVHLHDELVFVQVVVDVAGDVRVADVEGDPQVAPAHAPDERLHLPEGLPDHVPVVGRVLRADQDVVLTRVVANAGQAQDVVLHGQLEGPGAEGGVARVQGDDVHVVGDVVDHPD